MSLIDRVKNIILTPKTEWPVIDREPGDVPYIFTNYVAILAAIPAICGFIGMSIVGMSLPGVGTVRIPVASGLVNAIVGYLLAFAVVYVVALIVDALAPTFGGRKNFDSALKVTAYSYTPSWLVGVFLLIPGLRFLMILGLYGLYLLWLGLPVLMKSPQDKSLGYTVAVVVCAIVIGIVLGMIQGALLGYPRM
ncbi:MAG TPA: Yip1 family protein [Xanthobacteraceae bacterium]|nr:Yip1 family protein [Xanthobacteraceae bacterium]